MQQSRENLSKSLRRCLFVLSKLAIVDTASTISHSYPVDKPFYNSLTEDDIGEESVISLHYVKYQNVQNITVSYM